MFNLLIVFFSLCSIALSADISNKASSNQVNVERIVKSMFLGEQQTEKQIYELIEATKLILRAEPNILDVDMKEGERLTVVGDIHGQLYDLIEIFRFNGYPTSEHKYVFNGDFVDRGKYSLEVMIVLMTLKTNYPTSVFLIRGNHEDQRICAANGFFSELCRKKVLETFPKFTELFSFLPISAVIGEKYFVVHGGPSFTLEGIPITTSEINKLDRFKTKISSRLGNEEIEHMLWSDPSTDDAVTKNKRRSAGLYFGRSATKLFLDFNNLSLIIRSHSRCDTGFQENHDGKCLTVFSAPNYCGKHGNSGSVLNMTLETPPKALVFKASEIQNPAAARTCEDVDSYLFSPL